MRDIIEIIIKSHIRNPKYIVLYYIIILLIGLNGCSDQISTSIKNKKTNSLSKSTQARKGIIQPNSLYAIVDKSQLDFQNNKYLSIIRDQPTTVVVHVAHLNSKWVNLLKRIKGLLYQFPSIKSLFLLKQDLKNVVELMLCAGVVCYKMGMVALILCLAWME